MDSYQLLSSMVGSLAWPIAAIVIVVILRTRIAELFEKLEEFSFGGGKAKFSRFIDKAEQSAPNELVELEERKIAADEEAPKFTDTADLELPVDERFQTLLNISPNAAILDSWSQIERELGKLAKRHYISFPSERNDPNAMSVHLLDKGILPKGVVTWLFDLRKMRNSAAHSDNVTPTDAYRFKELAERVLRLLTSL